MTNDIGVGMMPFEQDLTELSDAYRFSRDLFAFIIESKNKHCIDKTKVKNAIMNHCCWQCNKYLLKELGLE